MKKHAIRRLGALVLVMAALGCGSVTAAEFRSQAECGAVSLGVTYDCTPLDRASGNGLAANEVLSLGLKGGVAPSPAYEVLSSIRSGPGDLGVATLATYDGKDLTGNYVGLYATATASYTDVLLVQSATLAAGTPVKVDLNQVLNFSVLKQGSATASVYATTQATSALWLSFSAQGTDSFVLEKCWGDAAGCASVPGDDTPQSFSYGGTVNAYVGGSIVVSGMLSTYSFASVLLGIDNGVAAGMTRSDSLHSAHTFVSTAAAGVDFVAESGHNYVPVPEPATVALLLAGLGVVGAVRRRVAGYSAAC